MDAVDLVVEALQQSGLSGRDMTLAAARYDDEGFDLILDPSGVDIRLEIKRRALVTDDVAAQLIRMAAHQTQADAVLLVVGDRVTESARALLLNSGAGYLDLRGRIALRTKNLVIDVPVDPVTERSPRTEPLAGKAGLEVAIALLMEPSRTPGVRQLAGELGRAPSTVSEVLSTMRADGLVDADSEGPGPHLFWAVADRWKAKRTYLANFPNPGMPSAPNSDQLPATALRLGLDHVENQAGWALTDTRAAAIYDAPVVTRADQPFDFYVPDVAVVRRAANVLGTAPAREARASVRVAPVAAVCRRRVDLETWRAPANHWPLAHPLFVALDLAQDSGRGREILQDWNPGPRWHRVW